MINNDDSFGYLLNDSLSEKERIFKLSKAILNEQEELVIRLLVNADDYDKYLTDELKGKVKAVVKGIVPDGVQFHVVYVKTETTEKYLTQKIQEFFYEESTLIFGKIKDAKISIEIDYGTVTVKIGVTPDVYGYLIECKYDIKLASYIGEFIMEEAEIEFYRIQDDKAGERGLRKTKTVGSVRPSVRLIDIRVNVNFLGTVAKKPMYICDATKKEQENVSLCGKVKEVKELQSKAGKIFFKAIIDDSTGSVGVLCFPRFPSQIEAVRSYLLPDVEICVEGELKMDERSGSYNLFARRLAQIQIDYSSINTDIVYNGVPEYYSTVTPAKYVETEQSDLFGEGDNLPSLLKGDIVVFDLETTGLNPSSCKIIEIGAVKMVDGVIKETFATLINPMEHIPDEASSVNNIYDKDVVGAPEFKDVVPDFFKFCKGATLCGHNVNFDMGFLTYYAKKEFYNFDHQTIDTLDLAKRILKRETRNKLENLCKEFDINLENAHRALFDTIATAKVLKKLAQLSEK